MKNRFVFWPLPFQNFMEISFGVWSLKHSTCYYFGVWYVYTLNQKMTHGRDTSWSCQAVLQYLVLSKWKSRSTGLRPDDWLGRFLSLYVLVIIHLQCEAAPYHDKENHSSYDLPSSDVCVFSLYKCVRPLQMFWLYLLWVYSFFCSYRGLHLLQ